MAFYTSQISDCFFLDANGNGLDDGDSGIEGVTVRLINTETLVPIFDLQGNPFTTVTDVNGNDVLDGLLPGSFRVQFDQPGLVFTERDVGDLGATVELREAPTLIATTVADANG